MKLPNIDQTDPANEVADDIAKYIYGGDTIDGAIRRIGKYGAPAALLDRGRRIYERRVGRIREFKEPGSLVTKVNTHGYWYEGPQKSDVFWPALKVQLEPTIDRTGLLGVDQASDKIVGLMKPPGTESISSRGLVLGYVQSGKTTSFMSVISKAADVGYRLFIVLSGVTDNLRSQTQERLQKQLVGDLTQQWYLLTDIYSDFSRDDNAPNLLSKSDNRLLAVVKKNPFRLQRLVKWLNTAGESTLRGCPILIIDDEADQASIDVGKRGRTSRINGLIGQILSKPKAAYIAYTATPFANLLISPKDFEGLYPRDFIVDLPKSGAYFGAERIFGREPVGPEEEGTVETEGLDVVRRVEIDEIPLVQPPKGKGAVSTWVPEIPASLRQSILWFILATAARRARGSGKVHSSMLIHTSMLSDAHNKLRVPVAALLDQLVADSQTLAGPAWPEFRELWELESPKVPALDGATTPVDWVGVQSEISEVLSQTRIIIDNYLSSERLLYSDESPVPLIAIGGNTLSRGLTLEGLVSSYFVRAASAYDTLLQMGRWFGYRRGYGDLTRVWMTSDLENWFRDLATVEEEVRRDIRRYEAEDLDPSELAVKIRSHPSMAITSAAKMRDAVRAEVSFGGTRQQTILFNHRDRRWLDQNLLATSSLLRKALGSGSELKSTSSEGKLLLKNVDSSLIIDFLHEYQFHPDALRMKTELICGYIQDQMAQGYLKKWNIVIMGFPTERNGTVDLGVGRQINLIERARIDIVGLPHANIKSLVTTSDRVADLGRSVAQVQAMADDKGTDAAFLKVREELLGDVGLLNIYPISRNSKPRETVKKDGQKRRMHLDAVQDVIGIGVFFPEQRGSSSSLSYYSADLSSELIEEPEDIDVDAADALDEAAGLAEEETTQ